MILFYLLWLELYVNKVPIEAQDLFLN